MNEDRHEIDGFMVERKRPTHWGGKNPYTSDLLLEVRKKLAGDLTTEEVQELCKSHNLRMVDHSYRPLVKVPVLDINDPITVHAKRICDGVGLSQHGIRWWRIHKLSHRLLNETHILGQQASMDRLLDRLGGLVDMSEPMTDYKNGGRHALEAVHNLAESIMKNAEAPYEYPYTK